MEPTLIVALAVAGACLVALALIATGRWSIGWLRRRRASEDPEVDLVSLALTVVPLAAKTVGALATRFTTGKGEDKVELVASDGTTTILFSDIADSTKLNVKLGDAEWVEVLRRHDVLVDAEVRGAGGKVIKRQGDGFMAAFQRPSPALDCALGLGPAMRKANGLDGIELRIGIHCGEVITERDDLFGTNVVLAARVAEQARPGEVLVTDSVVERLGDEAPKMRRIRSARLKGIPGRHAVHRVRT